METFDVPIYCLSFAGSEREARMQERFTGLELNNHAKFVEPIPVKSPMIDFYLRNRSEAKSDHGRRSASITYSYIQMIKQFVGTGKSYGVFCEDDVHLRKSFKKDLLEIISTLGKLKQHPKIVLLGCLSMFNDLHLPLYQGDVKVIKGNLHLYSYDEIWGAQMILLSRENAMDIVEMYDRPAYLSCPDGSYSGDCTFTKLSPRALIHPMLAVEEGNIIDNCAEQQAFHKICHDVNFNKKEYL